MAALRDKDKQRERFLRRAHAAVPLARRHVLPRMLPSVTAVVVLSVRAGAPYQRTAGYAGSNAPPATNGTPRKKGCSHHVVAASSQAAAARSGGMPAAVTQLQPQRCATAPAAPAAAPACQEREEGKRQAQCSTAHSAAGGERECAPGR